EAAATFSRSSCPSRTRRVFLQGDSCDHVDPHWYRDVLALPRTPPVVFRAGKFFSRSSSVRCDFADSLLQGYFDGELSDRRATEFERHLRHCGHCASELVDLDLLRDSLQLAHLYEPASASLRRKINEPLHAAAPTTGASQPRLWHWLVAAAALLFVVIVLGRVGRGFNNDD